MIIPKKKAAEPALPRSPDVLSLASRAGWPLDEVGGETALKVSAVFRCINFNAETISLMPFYLMDRGSRKRIEDHPVLRPLTVRPNECMTPADYKFTMQVNRDLSGNAYAYIGRNARTGRVEELLPLAPDLVELVFDEARHLHYVYTDPLSGRVYDLMPSQVIHYKAFTRDGIRGISPLTYARETVAKDRAAKAYERAIYNNGGRPSGVLYTEADLSNKKVEVKNPDGTTEMVGQKELVRRAWERVHSGGDNAFRTAVLDLGLKYQPIAMNNSDAQFVESNDITIADIARFFGTPLHVLMSGKQSYESNIQNRTEFIQTTALAIVNRCEEEDSYKLLSSEDAGRYRIRRNMDAALRGDTATRAAFYKSMREMGAYSVNDVLAREDLPDVPGGDTRQASLNFVPLEWFEVLSLLRNGGKNAVSDQ